MGGRQASYPTKFLTVPFGLPLPQFNKILWDFEDEDLLQNDTSEEVRRKNPIFRLYRSPASR